MPVLTRCETCGTLYTNFCPVCAESLKRDRILALLDRFGATEDAVIETLALIALGKEDPENPENSRGPNLGALRDVIAMRDLMPKKVVQDGDQERLALAALLGELENELEAAKATEVKESVPKLPAPAKDTDA